MRAIFQYLFAPVIFPKKEEKNRMSRVLYIFWVNAWALVGLNFVGMLLVYARKLGASILLVFIILILFIVRYFQRRGNIRFASFLFVLGAWAAYMTVIVLTGTIRTSIIAMPIAIVAMVIPLLGLPAGLISAILTLIATLGITLLEITGNPLPAYFPGAPLSNWFHLVIAFALIIVPLGQTWQEISTALARARKSEKRYINLFQYAPVMCLLVREEDGVQIISGCNTAFLDTLGYTLGEVLAQPLSKFCANTSRLTLENGCFQKGIQRKLDTSSERYLLASDGRIVPVLLQVAPEVGEDGSADTILAMFIDITDRKQAELAVLEEKDFTDHALNSLRDTFFVFDPKTREAIRWNKAVNDITGYSDDELQLLKTPYSFFSKDDVEKAETAIQKVYDEDFVSLELSLITKSGQAIPTEYTVTAIRDENGQVQYLITVGRDIRERQKAERALQKSEYKHRLLFEEANDGIFIIKDSRFTECNTRILEMFRAGREDIFGKRPHELSPEFQPNGKRTVDMEQEMLTAAIAGERQFFEWRHLRSDKTEFDVEVSLNLLELDNEIFVQAIVRDITERKQAEKKLAEAYDTTLEGWAKALELRDKETQDHSRRVVELTIKLARAMGIEGEDLTHIRRGAILHDIGKMGIPDKILRKPGKLTNNERKIVELHPIYGYELLSHIPHLEKAMDIPYCHHEHWDGGGYPRGLKGEEIPLAARIFSVIDTWDALLSDRPYSKAWSREEAIELITEESGTYFDPDVVEVFLIMVEKGKPSQPLV
jgi:PAS domain S-box-containing protein/putative nucleotidyltransferase with HDIG domain